jgi:hypothetical protein
MSLSQASRPGARPIPLLKGALGAAVALAALSLSTGSAQALVVTVGGAQYDITTLTGSYNDNSALLSSQPWFFAGQADSTLAEEFSGLVGSGLGTSNNGFQNPPSEAPYFAYDFVTDGVNDTAYLAYFRYGNVQIDALPGAEPQHTWAKATLLSASTSAPAPGPLPLFGAAASFGFSRQLRKRIQGRGCR